MRILNLIAAVAHLFITLAEGNRMNYAHFKKHAPLDDLEPMNSVLAVSSASPNDCSVKCSLVTGVMGLFYNRLDRRCYCSTGFHVQRETLIISEGYRYYILVGKCEIEGYRLLDKGFCVKLYDTPMAHNKANSYCEDEGGRLVRLDTVQKNQRLQQLIRDSTSKDIELMAYFIDGVVQNGRWIFGDNTTIPESVQDWEWYEPNGDANDMCLCLFSPDYQYGDTYCTGYDGKYNFGFVCERCI